MPSYIRRYIGIASIGLNSIIIYSLVAARHDTIPDKPHPESSSRNWTLGASDYVILYQFSISIKISFHHCISVDKRAAVVVKRSVVPTARDVSLTFIKKGDTPGDGGQGTRLGCWSAAGRAGMGTARAGGCVNIGSSHLILPVLLLGILRFFQHAEGNRGLPRKCTEHCL